MPEPLLRVRNLNGGWALRNVPVKGGKTRDIPMPTVVMQYLEGYVTQYLPTVVEAVAAVPDSDAYRETLAEVHFRRGDRDKAVAVMTKLLEEFPRTRLYHRQLARYKTGSLDSPTPETEDD